MACGAVVVWRQRVDVSQKQTLEAGLVGVVEAARYAGAESCAECHRAQYAAWRESTHARSGGVPTAVTLIAPFNREPIVFADAIVRPTLTTEGRASFEVAWRDRPVETLLVDGVVGGGHMQGGGTQGFFSRMRDGTVRFLPFDFSRQLDRWFCRSQPDGKWLPITADRPLASCTDWPPRRTLGAVAGASGCDQCHGSQIRTRWSPENRDWITEFASLSINCESCHGPARRHVEIAHSGRMGDESDIGVRSLVTLDKRESVVVCLQCHGEKLSLETGDGIIEPENFERRYSVLLPMLTDPPYTPDFRHKKFGYQGPHLASACFVDGAMTCTDCHDPHTQRYRDHLGRLLQGRDDDGQCTSCHASKAATVSRHTFHAEESPGSRCVACHMPSLQHPAVGERIPYARADHSVSVPRPGDDEGVGIVNACARCHQERRAVELRTQVVRWYGELKPRHPLIKAVMATQANAGSSGVELLRPDVDAPMLQFAAMTQYVLRFVRLDGGVSDSRAYESLRSLAASRDIDVAALAVTALHIADGRTARTRQLVTGVLRIRPELASRVKIALGYLAWLQQMAGQGSRALAMLRAAVQLLPTDADLLRELGGSLGQSGALSEALDVLAKSASLGPDRVLTHMMVGFTLQRSGDIKGAEASFVRASDLNPWDVVPLMQLVLVKMQQSDFAGAEGLLVRVTELDRRNVTAQVTLARLLAARGATRDALNVLDTALAFEPDNTSVRELQRRLRQAR